MSKKEYYKLVRDRIPEIIETSGRKCETEILSETEYLKAVDKKLEEELNEYLCSHNIEELADLIEVVYAATEAMGYTVEQLEQERLVKAEERGRFKKKILLKMVYDSH